MVPWEKEESKENFSIALTGKVFNLLCNDASLKAVLQ